MKLLQGSVLDLVTGTKITLETDAEVSFANSQSEDTQAGFLRVNGIWDKTPYQEAHDLPANSSLFKFHRDANGVLLSVAEQAELEGVTIEEFAASLSHDERRMFGLGDDVAPAVPVEEEKPVGRQLGAGAPPAEEERPKKRLSHMNKTELTEITRSRGITVPEGATNKQIADLIRNHK